MPLFINEGEWIKVDTRTGSYLERVNRLTVARAYADLAKAGANAKKLLAQGANVAGGTPEDFARHIAAETAKWQKVVKESGAKID